MKIFYFLLGLTLTFSSSFSQTCPTFLGTMIDACNSNSFEGDNEFMVLKNGTSDLKPANITIYYSSSKPPSTSPNNTFKNLTSTYTTAMSNYIASLNANITTCTNPIATSVPANGIPAGATFFVFSPKASQVYDLSSYCASAPLYVLFDTYFNAKDGCTDNLSNSIGAASGTNGIGFNRCGTFKNYDASTTNTIRYFSVKTTTCTETASIVSYSYSKLPVYDTLHDGGFVSWKDTTAGYTNNGCSTIIVAALNLIHFSGFATDKNIKLDWQIANDENTTMIIEKSVDGIHFEAIGTQKTTTSGNFNFIDNNPVVGNNYYRIHLIGNNGNTKYSSIIDIKFGESPLIINSIYPSPVSSQMTIAFTNAKTERALLKIIDETGRICIQKSIVIRSGNNTLTLPANNLAKGFYTIQIQTDQSKVHSNFIKK